MTLEKVHSVYFIGIGGIGMSALARWFNANGRNVYGYDRTETVLTKDLVSEGIEVIYKDEIDLIPMQILEDASEVLIVYTPAIPHDHRQYNALVDRGYEVMKRSQVLGILTDSIFTIAVAGTHGKTTTSSMIAHLLKNAGRNCTAFVGGIMTNYNSNVIIGKDGEDALMVVEADEFDRSFLTLRPDVAIITAIDADHLDIYGTADELKASFGAFISNIKKDGQLFVEESIATKIDLEKYVDIKISTYGLRSGDVSAGEVKIDNGHFIFEYINKEHSIKNLQLSLPGFHNVENALAAISASKSTGMLASEIKSGIESYRGVKRRFEYIIKTDSLVFVDDYAHHPVEIEALLKSINKMFPDKKITVVFQPHLYTRTRDFAQGFSEALSMADDVILLDIYPARELPIPGVTSEMLLKEVTSESKSLCDTQDLLKELKNRDLEVILTVGAGDIDKMVGSIKELLTQN